MRSSLPVRLGFGLGAALLAASALFLSVGGNDPSLISVTGKVTVNGRPLEKGMIKFLGTGHSTAAVGEVIHKGNYVIESSEALVPGAYQVWISGLGPETLSIPRGQAELTGRPEPQEPLPASFNSASILRVEIPRNGAHTFSFDLKY